MPYTALSVEEVQKDLKMNLYPNPASGEVTVRLTSEQMIGKIDYQIRDISGRMVQQGVHEVDANGGIFKADLAGLDAGMYFMHVNTKQGANTMKFIVK